MRVAWINDLTNMADVSVDREAQRIDINVSTDHNAVFLNMSVEQRVAVENLVAMVSHLIPASIDD